MPAFEKAKPTLEKWRQKNEPARIKGLDAALKTTLVPVRE
jgi:hypothetical protein